MGTYEIHSSKRIFDGAVVGLRVDQVEMPGGGTAGREVVEHDRAVAVVALGDDGTVVLIEQYRHPMGHRLWELPAGLMDVDGEHALPAAQRELAEETGLTAARWEVLVDVAASPGFTTEAVRVFLARGLTEIGRQGEIAHEEADLRIIRVPLADAVDAVLAGRIVNASAVAGLLATDRLLRTGDRGRPADRGWLAGPAVVTENGPDLSPDPHW
jgi:ADP-ribose pyrophosphatase